MNSKEINIMLNADVNIKIQESEDGPMEIDFSSIEIDIQNIDYIEPEDN